MHYSLVSVLPSLVTPSRELSNSEGMSPTSSLMQIIDELLGTSSARNRRSTTLASTKPDRTDKRSTLVLPPSQSSSQISPFVPSRRHVSVSSLSLPSPAVWQVVLPVSCGKRGRWRFTLGERSIPMHAVWHWTDRGQLRSHPVQAGPIHHGQVRRVSSITPY